MVGWLDTKMFDETGDEQKSQGWCPTVRRHQRRRQDHQAVESSRERRSIPRRTPRFGSKDILKRGYGVIPHPDGSVWTSRRYPVPGQLVRLELGQQSARDLQARKSYEPPYQNDKIDQGALGLSARAASTSIATA